MIFISNLKIVCLNSAMKLINGKKIKQENESSADENDCQIIEDDDEFTNNDWVKITQMHETPSGKNLNFENEDKGSLENSVEKEAVTDDDINEEKQTQTP